MEQKHTRTIGHLSEHPLVVLSAPTFSAQALFLDLVLFLAGAARDVHSVGRSSNDLDTSFKIMLSRVVGRVVYVVEFVCEHGRILVVLASASSDMNRIQYFEQCRRVLDQLLDQFSQHYGIRPSLALDPDGVYHPPKSTFRAALESAQHAIAVRNQQT